MRFMRFSAAVFLLLWCARIAAQEAKPNAPIRVKVVVVAMFERGEDTGDTPGEFQYWVEREHLDQVLPLPAGYHHLRMNQDGVVGLLAGVGTAKATASVMALGLDPRFDLSKAYWLVAGIGGGDPNDVSLGSAVWVDHVIDGDLAFEIDARQMPADWPTGYVPLGKSTPYEKPVDAQRAGVFALNSRLTAWAFSLTRGVPLADSEDLKKFGARFQWLHGALRLPFVDEGDQPASSIFWHG